MRDGVAVSKGGNEEVPASSFNHNNQSCPAMFRFASREIEQLGSKFSRVASTPAPSLVGRFDTVKHQTSADGPLPERRGQPAKVRRNCRLAGDFCSL